MSLDVKNTQTKIFDYDDTILAYWQSIKNCPIPDVDEELELYKKTIRKTQILQMKVYKTL